MSIDPWLEIHAPGYNNLSQEERLAIKEFSLLWSLFESNVLGGDASAARIRTAVVNLSDKNRLTLAPFADQVTYFFSRYHNGRDFTPQFSDLRLRNNDQPELVRQVLTKQITDDISMLATLLIIIYRLRNNLLHGHKWSYGIRGQLANFRNANMALMTYISIHQ